MTTATEAIKSRESEHRKRSFEYGIESFLNQWKPHDRREASQFEAELHSLIRQVYTDAQAPILERFTQLAMSIPTPFAMIDKV